MSDKKWQTWVWVKWKPNTPSNAWEKWQGNKSITGAWTTLGEWDCVLCLNIQTPDEVENFVWKNLRTNDWVQATHTTFAKQWW